MYTPIELGAGMQVRARRRIMQSPLSSDPPVYQGTVGIIDDVDGCTGDLIVDFGEPFGHVVTNPDEVRATVK